MVGGSGGRRRARSGARDAPIQIESGGKGESSGGRVGGYGLGFPQSGDMEEGSGAPAGPAWLAQWPAGPRPSEGGLLIYFVVVVLLLYLSFLFSFILSCFILVA